MSSFIDPIKELPGPPSLSGNGLKFKSPTVDSPNVNLPSSIPKNLNPSSALKKSKILNIKNKASALQDKVGGLTGGLQDKVGGLGANWSPEKFNPKKITGNSKFVNPIDGKISDTKSLLQDKVGGVTSGLQDRLDNIKSNMPKPKINVPTGERIRIIKIK